MSVFTTHTKQVAALQQLFSDKKNIVLSTHINPDGDAIGSSMGLKIALEKAGFSVTAIVPNAMPKFLKWLDPNKTILAYDTQTEKANKAIADAEIIFCLDYNTLKRVDKMGEEIAKSSAPTVLIDHHQSPDEFEFMFSDVNTSSTCELIYEFLSLFGWENKLDLHAAKCLYTGIMTDTGSFRYKGTSANTFRVAGILVGLGVVPSEINDNINFTSTLDKLKLLGHSIHNCLNIIPNKNVAYIYLSPEDLLNHNYQSGDTEGLVNMALAVEDVHVSVLFKEQDGKIKISFRSKGDISVNDFARTYFSGGGHINAAGGISFESWEATKTKFLNAVDETF